MEDARLARENAELIEGLLLGLPAQTTVDIAVCPPNVYLWEVGRLLKDSIVKLGAQTVCAESLGAFTGEASAAMLKDVGCTYVIVGHSERRTIYREDDALVARKFLAAQSQGLIPILCVGETLDEREKAQTMQVVSRQLHAVLDVAGPGRASAGGGRVRAGLGDRHGQKCDTGAGAGSSRTYSRRGRGP